ncbi:MAG TPA: TolC family protein [Thermoanaerobaculia bacterium]
MFRSLSILPLAVLMAIPAAAQMDDDPSRGPSVSVDALVAEALARSPDLAAARSRQTAAREMERPAAALADPTVEPLVQMADFPNYTIGTEDMSMAGVQVSQPLPYPGKRRARAETARAETAQRESEAVDLERRIAREVRSLYARLYAVDQEQKTLEAGRELADLLAATAKARYSSGGGEQESLLKAQLQGTRLEEQLEDHHAERRAIVAQLNRWLDRPGDSPVGPATSLPDVTTPSTAPSTPAESTRVRMARAAVATAERRLASARLDLKPDFTPSAGLATRGPRGPVLMVNVEIELPFWKREKQEPRIRAAEAELESARQELRAAEAETRAEVARLASERGRAERQIVRYREGIVPQSSATFDAARASYLAGRGDFSNLIEDFNLWLEARVQLARREADRYTAWAGLEALTGGLP